MHISYIRRLQSFVMVSVACNLQSWQSCEFPRWPPLQTPLSTLQSLSRTNTCGTLLLVSLGWGGGVSGVQLSLSCWISDAIAHTGRLRVERPPCLSGLLPPFSNDMSGNCCVGARKTSDWVILRPKDGIYWSWNLSAQQALIEWEWAGEQNDKGKTDTLEAGVL